MLGKEDLKGFVGKEIYLLFWQKGEELEELDYGLIIKVTSSALHLDTSRNERNYNPDIAEEYILMEFTRVIPLALIVDIEIN